MPRTSCDLASTKEMEWVAVRGQKSFTWAAFNRPVLKASKWFFPPDIEYLTGQFARHGRGGRIAKIMSTFTTTSSSFDVQPHGKVPPVSAVRLSSRWRSPSAAFHRSKYLTVDPKELVVELDQVHPEECPISGLSILRYKHTSGGVYPWYGTSKLPHLFPSQSLWLPDSSCSKSKSSSSTCTFEGTTKGPSWVWISSWQGGGHEETARFGQLEMYDVCIYVSYIIHHISYIYIYLMRYNNNNNHHNNNKNNNNNDNSNSNNNNK